MGFSVEVGIPAITVFIQGLLSFSHPACCHLYRFTSDIWQAERGPSMKRDASGIREKRL